MTYSDIYKKFLIQYDKADVISSYPSLTKIEVATMLDKAYLSIIALKFTGVNQRGAGFESDSKAIEDIRNLLKTTKKDSLETSIGDIGTINPGGGIITDQSKITIDNSKTITLPNDMLYYISSKINIYEDNKWSNIILTSHQNALNFIVTDYNKPWIKNPIAYIEGNTLTILYDIYKLKKDDSKYTCSITYIKKPIMFEETIDNWNTTNFELPNSVAEEVITLAKIFALENVESPRLNTSVQTKSLEL